MLQCVAVCCSVVQCVARDSIEYLKLQDIFRERAKRATYSFVSFSAKVPNTFAERDLQLKASYASSPPLRRVHTYTITYTRTHTYHLYEEFQHESALKRHTYTYTYTYTHTHSKKTYTPTHTHTHAHIHNYIHIHKHITNKRSCSKRRCCTR